MPILINVELDNFYFKLRAELFEWRKFDTLLVPVYDFSMIEGESPIFQEIRGMKDVFLKERYQEEFLFLCNTLFETIGRNCGSSICYLDSQQGNLPKFHQFLGNLQRPPIEGFLCGWNERGDWATELVTPTFLNFDDDIMLQFKKYATNELIGFVVKEMRYVKHTFAKLKIEGFEVNHNENADTPLRNVNHGSLPHRRCFAPIMPIPV